MTQPIILTGDALTVLAMLPDSYIHTCVTSPYFALRDYGHAGQIGLEQTPDEYVAALVAVFREVRRVLRNDGTLWLNLGDSYAGGGNGGGGSFAKDGIRCALPGTDKNKATRFGKRGAVNGIKPKDLIGIPWMVAFALRVDGWYLRQWMPWVKRNPMPESTRDRPTSACETIFLLSKSSNYFYDYEAVKKNMAPSSVSRLAQNVDAQNGSARANGGARTDRPMKAVGGDKQRGHSRRHAGFNDRWDAMSKDEQSQSRAFRNADLFFQSLQGPHGAIGNEDEIIALDVSTRPYKGAHFATFPPKLIEPCILAGCPEGGTVLDPFGGAGTTGLVAKSLNRASILIELNPEYVALATARCAA